MHILDRHEISRTIDNLVKKTSYNLKIYFDVWLCANSLMLSFKVLRDSRPLFHFVKKIYIRVLVVLVDCWKLLVLK